VDIEDYLAEMLSNEFNVIIEDGSLTKVQYIIAKSAIFKLVRSFSFVSCQLLTSAVISQPMLILMIDDTVFANNDYKYGFHLSTHVTRYSLDSGFLSLDSGFHFWIPDSSLRIPDSTSWIPDPLFGFRIPLLGFQIPLFGFRIPLLGFWIPLFGSRIPLLAF
jgi:hypothetical protein